MDLPERLLKRIMQEVNEASGAGDLASDARVLFFKEAAGGYCAFIDQLCAGTVQQPITELLRLLSALAFGAVNLPPVLPVGEDDSGRLNRTAWKAMGGQIHSALAEHCAALETLAKDDGEDEGTAWLLWDDLADIYVDMREGLALFERGGGDDLLQAVWAWRFAYEAHWGQHLFRALQACHDLRYRLYRD